MHPWRSLSLFLLLLFIASGTIAAWRWKPPALMNFAEKTQSTSFSLSGVTMGGTWSVKIIRLPTTMSREALETSVSNLLHRLDQQMSIWKPDSDLSRFNQYRGSDWYAVPPELAEVVAAAQRVSDETGGAFDATVGPLVLLWGFGPRRAGVQIGQIPPDDAIAAARKHVNYHLLECRLSPPALRKHDPDLYVDLGGIAKGYAADVVAGYLQSLGVRDYLIAIGGELRAAGVSGNGRPWRVGIETPTPDVRRIFRTLELRDGSLSTSGDYRNFFDAGGKRFCHEIDPHTGRPIENGLASVSVMHASGTYADAMATALMVLGPREGFELACRLKLAALFTVRRSDRFETLRTPEFAARGDAGNGNPGQTQRITHSSFQGISSCSFVSSCLRGKKSP
jgi:thiamine biosynthesis lipoprotein